MSDCKTCKEKRRNLEPVPYIVYKAEMASKDRANRRWFVAWLITFFVLVAFAVGVVFYETQWETSETTNTEVHQEVETGEGDAFVAGIGDIAYGKDTANG